MGYDSRIGHQFLSAGLGWGGSCFPKDVRALIHMAAAHGSHPQLLRAVFEINHDQRLAVVQKVRSLLGDLEGRTICLLGLAFKPNTDDMRNAPSVELAALLRHEGCSVRAYDPAAGEKARQLLPQVTVAEDPYAAASSADAAILVTEWDEFRLLDLPRLRGAMRTPVIVDGRNAFDPEEFRAAGFVYSDIGRSGTAESNDAWSGAAHRRWSSSSSGWLAERAIVRSA